ncbi:hypothetical protein SLA2020_425860 [Shorea laevis]
MEPNVAASGTASQLLNSSGHNGGYENGGFATGGEEFGAVVERPTVMGPVGGKAIVGGDSDVPFVDYLEGSMCKVVLPTEKVSDNVDDDDEIVEKFRVLKEESFWGGGKSLQGNGGETLISRFEGQRSDLNLEGKENLGEFEVAKLDMEVTEPELNGGRSAEDEISNHKQFAEAEPKESREAGFVVEDRLVLVGAAGEGASLTEELAGDKVVGLERVEFIGEGDLVTGAVHDLAIAYPGETRGSEIMGIVGDVTFFNGFENVESDIARDTNFDHLAQDNFETTMETSKLKVDVDAEEKGNSQTANFIVDEVTEDEQDDEKFEVEGSSTDGEPDDMILESSEAAKRFLEEWQQRSGAGSHPVAEGSNDHSLRIDGQVVTDSDEEVDTDEEGEGKELLDSAALAALLKAATGADSDGGGISITSQDRSRLFSVEHPAGLGSSLGNMKPAPRSHHPNLFTFPTTMTGRDSEVNLSEEEKKKLEKLQQIRVKFLRLVQRLGHSLEDPIVAQVLYRLALVAGKPNSAMFSLDSAKNTALQLEAEGKEDLNFSLNILVLGKTGVGKSATINSLFGEEKASIHAFEPATDAVKEVTGMVDGVKITVIDTPGLKSSAMEQRDNRQVLASIKKLTKRHPADVVLYVDRLDTQARDLNDCPLLRSITSSLGSSIWRNAIVTLTHAASAPPDGPSGSSLSYEVFVGQRSHVVQKSIGRAVGDLRLMNPGLMNPVSLVENHPSCRKNRDGQKVLPNGQSWRPQLLLLCFSMKILSDASSLSKPQEPIEHKKLFGFRVRSPPLPYLLSWLLQSRSHPKLATDQGGDNGDFDIDMADFSDSDQEEDEDEYEQLPPFRPLNKAQLAKLSKEQRKAYLEEYDYRVKLLQKKQWREEIRKMRVMKKKGKPVVGEYGNLGEAADQEDGAPASVPVPLPDMILPPSFDADNSAYRYRFLEPTSQFLARPVLDTHGWDHDCGYDGVNLEHSLAIMNRFPVAIALQLTKDKKEFNIHLDSSVSAKHGENGSTLAGFDIQNVGKQLAYILRGETKFKNFRKNKTAAGFSVTFLGENVATGFKLEDQIAVGKRLLLVGSTGTVRSQGDSAYGANLEVQLRDADFPIGQDQSSLGLSLVKWRGDLALGANLQSQFSIGRGSKVAIRAGLNNKMSGQITVRTSSSDQLQIALVALLPIAKAIYKSIWPGVRDKYSMY